MLLTLVRRFWIIALGLVWGAALGGLVSFLITPAYQANVYLMVVTDSAEVENTAAYDYTQAYSKLPTVPAVVGPVLSDYGIESNAEGIEETINVEVPLNTPVFQVIVSSSERQEVAALANDVGQAVTDFANDRLAPGTGYRSVVVAEATSPQQPISPDWRLNVAVGAAVGLMLGGALALLWDDLRRMRKGRKFES